MSGIIKPEAGKADSAVSRCADIPLRRFSYTFICILFGYLTAGQEFHNVFYVGNKKMS